MRAISELFSKTTIVVPCEEAPAIEGLSLLKGNNLQVVPLSVPRGSGLRRKIAMLSWCLTDGPKVWRSIKAADAVHTPIPGDVGTIGMMFALILKKRLFVRHCGNWLEPRTSAEHIWKRGMELFAGARNVMFATGGADHPPSLRNSNIKWIFSTSLSDDQIRQTEPRQLRSPGPKLVIACRQELKKGTDLVIKAMPLILKSFTEATLDIVGSGSQIESLKSLAKACEIDSRVKFHGKVKQSEVLSLLKRSDVFCFPTSASEGFPKAVLEALASGLPVVTTKVSVLPQLIGNGCGVLLDEATPDAIAAAVREVCSDVSKYREMSTKAIDTARRYTLENWQAEIGQTLSETWQAELGDRAVSDLMPQAQT
jgi:glycosyltransferase involved in cell wall biosynthesis